MPQRNWLASIYFLNTLVLKYCLKYIALQCVFLPSNALLYRQYCTTINGDAVNFVLEWLYIWLRNLLSDDRNIVLTVIWTGDKTRHVYTLYIQFFLIHWLPSFQLYYWLGVYICFQLYIFVLVQHCTQKKSQQCIQVKRAVQLHLIRQVALVRNKYKQTHETRVDENAEMFV